MNKITVVIFHPQRWFGRGHWPYIFQTPGSSGVWENITYIINPDVLPDADFIVVHEDIDFKQKLKTSTGNFIFIPGEEKSSKSYPEAFINQFDRVITSRDDIKHPQVIRTHYLHPWSIKKTYDEITTLNPTKRKSLSAVVSNSTWLEGHRLRFAFMNKMKGHFKDNLDWFAKGENTFIEDKWEGLEPYFYSIAVENSSHSGYFTEKISDCFLSEAMPFYWGCPDLNNYFDDRSFISLDLHDYLSSIRTIEDCISEQVYHERIAFVKESKRLFLAKYHFIAALTAILNSQEKPRPQIKKTIRPQTYFEPGIWKRLLNKGTELIFRQYES